MFGGLEDILLQLWLPIMGAIGAFIIEAYLLVTKPELIHEINRYKLKMGLGIFTGFVLAYVLQPSDITQAFAIGLGWEAVLSSVTKESNIITSKDDRVKRTLEREAIPITEDTLETALEKMQKIGAKDTIPVIDEVGRLMGVVTDGMIEREREKGEKLSKVKLSEIMIGATGVIKVDENDSVAKAIKIAEKQLIDRRPVKDIILIDRDGIVKGLLHFDQLKTLDRSLISR